jgi:hypothetical protein
VGAVATGAAAGLAPSPAVVAAAGTAAFAVAVASAAGSVGSALASLTTGAIGAGLLYLVKSSTGMRATRSSTGAWYEAFFLPTKRPRKNTVVTVMRKLTAIRPISKPVN